MTRAWLVSLLAIVVIQTWAADQSLANESHPWDF